MLAIAANFRMQNDDDVHASLEHAQLLANHLPAEPTVGAGTDGIRTDLSGQIHLQS